MGGGKGLTIRGATRKGRLRKVRNKCMCTHSTCIPHSFSLCSGLRTCELNGSPRAGVRTKPEP